MCVFDLCLWRLRANRSGAKKRVVVVVVVAVVASVVVVAVVAFTRITRGANPSLILLKCSDAPA